MGHGCHRCGSPNSCECSRATAASAPPKNYLPPELAAQILERENRLERGGPPDAEPLPDDERELLTILAEECGEVVQRCTKILRFGMRVNPWTGKHNRDQLELELGDVQAIARVLDALDVVDRRRIEDYADKKIAALRKPDGRLRYAKIPAAKGFR